MSRSDVDSLKIFAGRNNIDLAQRICGHLDLPLGAARTDVFPDGELIVRLNEDVRGRDCFVVLSTCHPINDNLMELLIFLDCLKRASARRITVVTPYFGYARQDRKDEGRVPITAKLVANLITAAHADRVLTMDLHAPAIEGFFDIPVDHLQAGPLLAEYIRELNLPRPVVVSPDAGGVGRANGFRERIGAGLAIIAKQRPQPDIAEMIEMVGDVEGKTAVIVDDMISTGGTLAEAARALRERGATAVYACATHGIFAGDALEIMADSVLVETIVTNTIPLPDGYERARVRAISVAPLFAEAIMRIHKDLSLSALFS
mgnify:CR=1 FL=1